MEHEFARPAWKGCTKGHVHVTADTTPKQAHSCTGAWKKWTHIEGTEECCDCPERKPFNVQIILYSSRCYSSTHIGRTQHCQGGISQHPKRRRLQASKWRKFDVENCLSAWQDWKMQLCRPQGRPKCSFGARHAAQRRHPQLETGRASTGALCATDVRPRCRVRMLAFEQPSVGPEAPRERFRCRHPPPRTRSRDSGSCSCLGRPAASAAQWKPDCGAKV